MSLTTTENSDSAAVKDLPKGTVKNLPKGSVSKTRMLALVMLPPEGCMRAIRRAWGTREDLGKIRVSS